MKDNKGIPPELVAEMIRLGIKPDDEFFLAIEILAAMGKSLEDVVRDVAAAIDALRADNRETVNVMIGEMQAVFDRSQEQTRVTFHGGDGVVGILELMRQAKEETISAAAGLQVAAGKMDTAAIKVEGMVGRVYSREVKSFWVVAAAFGLTFGLTVGLMFAAIAAANAYRLDRVVATRNAAAIVKAYGEAFSHHPLPEDIYQDALEWADLDGPYQKGIGLMPPQLTYVLSAALVAQNFGSPSKFNGLVQEIERLKLKVADKENIELVGFGDGTRAVRIADGYPQAFPIENHDGLYARVYSAPPR